LAFVHLLNEREYSFVLDTNDRISLPHGSAILTPAALPRQRRDNFHHGLLRSRACLAFLLEPLGTGA